ncbi:hypothetical protein P167DRAFT_565253 [Morchella conica CCBAS932]|uniref:Uncharacterized protein n=1 Tax=Morchella conica CCBAS932 TaxID=1392247 RepID=A0A3N4KSX7_9PEZI|nr:hypothetical protein P167DRAFT_565253 [Morchella conica CCBAS932]
MGSFLCLADETSHPHSAHDQDRPMRLVDRRGGGHFDAGGVAQTDTQILSRCRGDLTRLTTLPQRRRSLASYSFNIATLGKRFLECFLTIKRQLVRRFCISVVNERNGGRAQKGNPAGSAIDLGFAHDGDVCFTLSGTTGNFTSTYPSTDWMQRNLATLGPRPLRDIGMPGTYNSGMSVSRYLRQRGGRSPTPSGPSATSTSQSSLTSTASPTPSHHSPTSPSPPSSAAPPHKAAVLVLTDAPACTLSIFPDAGFYTAAQLDMHDRYTNTMSADWMVTDQLDKLSKHAKDKFFILPWILTQEGAKDLVMR